MKCLIDDGSFEAVLSVIDNLVINLMKIDQEFLYVKILFYSNTLFINSQTIKI